MKNLEPDSRMDFQQDNSVQEEEYWKEYEKRRKESITETIKEKVKIQWTKDEVKAIKKKARKSMAKESFVCKLEIITRDLNFQTNEYKHRLLEMNDCISRYRKENEEKKESPGGLLENVHEHVNGRANYLAMEVAIANFISARATLDKLRVEKDIYDEFFKD